MSFNENSKLIKERKTPYKNITLEKENTKTCFCYSSIIIILSKIIFYLLMIFLTYMLIRINNDGKENIKPEKILKELLKNKTEVGPFPATESTKYSPTLLDEKKICSNNKKFVIMRRTSCKGCGLFSYYIVHLGCMINYLKLGYIPILDVGSFSNIFTGDDSPDDNPWEQFFNQPCGYTLADVVKMKDVEISECECVLDMPDEKTVYSKKIMYSYHHKIQEKYMSVKKKIIKEVKYIWRNLFGFSKNVLGIFMRGTDYRATKPSGHSRQPPIETAINDTINMDQKNKYKYFFLGTEDNDIRDAFIKKFGNKLKYLLPDKKISYNKNDGLITYNRDVYGNMKFLKTYLYNVVILSRCVDIILSRTSGAAGVYIMSNGYRNKIVYYMGEY